MSTMKVERKALAEVREYAALVSSAGTAFEAIGQLYRDRAAGENSFDELKNQGRWGSCTTLARERGKRSAQAAALNDDGRRGRVRLAHAKARLDAITRRPLLVAGLARIEGDTVRFEGLILRPDGSEAHAITRVGPIGDAEALGRDAGRELKARGGPDFFVVGA